MIKYYSQKKSSILCYFDHKPGERYWDERWDSVDVQKVMKNAHKNRYVTRISQKYLKGGAKILEGGCGLGQKLFALSKKGFDVVGIDNAEKTVEKMNKLYPELNIQKGDLRWLEFPDETFDGYWSF